MAMREYMEEFNLLSLRCRVKEGGLNGASAIGSVLIWTSTKEIHDSPKDESSNGASASRRRVLVSSQLRSEGGGKKAIKPT